VSATRTRTETINKNYIEICFVLGSYGIRSWYQDRSWV